VTEDEAFIRAIVDSPGDDTPRLVYADWLDEHADPRGPYLRAEVAWAATDDSSDRETLRQLAKSLATVWVARVSRPPVGVCCDHMRFERISGKVTEIDIGEYEQVLGAGLPPEFRAFLLNYNGGTPTPHDFKTPTYPEPPDWLTLGRFEPLVPPAAIQEVSPNEPIQYGLESTSEFVRYLAQGAVDIIEGLLPIADTEFDLGYLFLSLRPATRGRVYHFSDYCHQADDADRLVPVAESLPALFHLVGRSAEFGAVHEGYINP
jgi:uncharacterized protein (TIGR02996 family)